MAADVYCPECLSVETSDGPRVRLCAQHAERDRLASENAALKSALAEGVALAEMLKGRADLLESRAREVLRTVERCNRQRHG